VNLRCFFGFHQIGATVASDDRSVRHRCLRCFASISSISLDARPVVRYGAAVPEKFAIVQPPVVKRGVPKWLCAVYVKQGA
jgi:hypothetical protein